MYTYRPLKVSLISLKYRARIDIFRSWFRGTDLSKLKLNFSDGPQFRHPPVSVETHFGATEILQCNVDGNPAPEILWFHEDSERTVATSPNISVFVSPDTAGRYYCKARVPGFPELTGYANIYIRAPPNIVSQRIQYVPDEGVVKVR